MTYDELFRTRNIKFRINVHNTHGVCQTEMSTLYHCADHARCALKEAQEQNTRSRVAVTFNHSGYVRCTVCPVIGYYDRKSRAAKLNPELRYRCYEKRLPKLM